MILVTSNGQIDRNIDIIPMRIFWIRTNTDFIVYTDSKLPVLRELSRINDVHR